MTNPEQFAAAFIAPPDDDIPEVPCPICGQRKEWVECWQCAGEGTYDETEIDPFEGDPFANCPECAGRGGWLEYISVHQEKNQ